MYRRFYQKSYIKYKPQKNNLKTTNPKKHKYKNIVIRNT